MSIDSQEAEHLRELIQAILSRANDPLAPVPTLAVSEPAIEESANSFIQAIWADILDVLSEDPVNWRSERGILELDLTLLKYHSLPADRLNDCRQEILRRMKGAIFLGRPIVGDIDAAVRDFLAPPMPDNDHPT